MTETVRQEVQQGLETWWCDGCGRTKPGWAVPDDNSVIRDFAMRIGLVDNAGQPTAVGSTVTLDFYGRLLAAAPYLRERFGEDLLDASAALDGRGARQRDRLLKALLAVMTLFNPGDERRMENLSNTLEAMAQAHTKHHAKIEEYGAVVACLLSVLAEHAGRSNIPRQVWEEAYEPVLRRALTYASGRMMAAESAATGQSAEDLTDTAVLEAVPE